jgi:hypothetical protein
MGTSIRAYARHRGVSHVSVLRAANSGRITLEPDGSVDIAKADAAWAQSTEPGLSKTRAKKKDSDIATAMGSVRQTLKEQGLPSRDNVTFVQARTAHEIAKAHLARIRLQERKGELVDKAKAIATVFKLAREARDSWINWPARVAPIMAAELRMDTQIVHDTLLKYVRAHLNEIAEAPLKI